MPESRDKASKWINVALVVALLLAPVAWYVAAVNATNHNSDSLSVADALWLSNYYPPPSLLLLFFDPAEYNRRSRNFAFYLAVMKLNSPYISQGDETFLPIPESVQKLPDQIERASAGSK